MRVLLLIEINVIARISTYGMIIGNKLREALNQQGHDGLQ